MNNIFNSTKFKDYFFKDQILRATLSVSNNIAEWFERETDNELRRYLYISRWSIWEVRSMLYLALDCDYINENKFNDLSIECKIISSMLYKYIKKIQAL